MTDTPRNRTRIIIAAGVVILLALVAALLPYLRQKSRGPIIARHADVYRERHTPKAHAAEPGTVGILIAFVPEIPVPPGGWKVNTQLPIESVAPWLKSVARLFEVDEQFGAIGLTLPRPRVATVRQRGASSEPSGVPPQPPIDRHRIGAFAARGTAKVSDLTALRRVLSTQRSFRGIFSDPPIVSDADGGICVFPPAGNAEAVVEAARPDPGEDANTVLLGIVDLGFGQENVSYSAPDLSFDEDFGFSPGAELGDPGDYPGDEHGNMCAYDATLVATHATLADIRVGDGETQRLSDAEKAYNAIYTKLTDDEAKIKNRYHGFVLSNSWGLYSPDDQLEPSERYFDNAEHPFTIAVKRLIDVGVDVVFSAGDSGCGAPGGTIWGANSLADVISVAAVDSNKARITVLVERARSPRDAEAGSQRVLRIHRHRR